MKLIIAITFTISMIGIPVFGLPTNQQLVNSKVAVRNGLAEPHQLQPYKPPLTLIELWNLFLKAVRNWFADLILQLLGITASALIREINTCTVGMNQLVAQAVLDLQVIIEKVPTEIKQELNEIINNALETALEIMEPILDQLRQIMFHLPDSYGNDENVPQDFVSDLIEALLGISLQEFIGNINTVFIEMANLLNETLIALHSVASKVSPDIAAEIQLVIENTVVAAQELLRPLITMLDKLPIYRSENSEAGIESALKKIRTINNQQIALLN